MLLRDHRLLNNRGFPSWPPRWMPRKNSPAPEMHGEVGVLTAVTPYFPQPSRQFSPQMFFFMENQGSRYIGVVFVGDAAFCRQLAGILQDYVGRTLEDIGAIDLSALM
jgi:hypothetical protein